jgi:tRNA (guanine10-N2)-dimethyltransferase
LVLLSGEHTSIPEAEARALFLAYDERTTFNLPEKRILIADSTAHPEKVARRIAFARRVGLLLTDPSDASERVRGKRVRVRRFHIEGGTEPSTQATDFASLLNGLDVTVDLEDPEYEFSVIEGEQSSYIALSAPSSMRQSWALRRPRKRPFFHPSAIFPKLSRALVNLTRCREGDCLLDPFVGTGSLPIEASEAGMQSVVMDRSRPMAYGALANMHAFHESWLGVIRADAYSPPLVAVDGIATDIPYGRASSAGGMTPQAVADLALQRLSPLLKAGGRFVVMHPSHVRVEGSSDLSVEEEHYIYIHRKLTRAITILRKT